MIELYRNRKIEEIDDLKFQYPNLIPDEVKNKFKGTVEDFPITILREDNKIIKSFTKDVDDLTFHKVFKVPVDILLLSHLVIFINGNKVIVFKSRVSNSEAEKLIKEIADFEEIKFNRFVW